MSASTSCGGGDEAISSDAAAVCAATEAKASESGVDGGGRGDVEGTATAKHDEHVEASGQWSAVVAAYQCPAAAMQAWTTCSTLRAPQPE